MNWDRKGIPHKGWQTTGVTDLRDEGARDTSAYATCEMCGRTGIRYVHQMVHPEYGLLAVGRFCAAKMAADYVATGRERRSSRALRDVDEAAAEAAPVQQAAR